MKIIFHNIALIALLFGLGVSTSLPIVHEAGLFSFARGWIEKILGRSDLKDARGSAESLSQLPSNMAAQTTTQVSANDRSRKVVAGSFVNVDLSAVDPEYGPCKRVALALPAALANEHQTFGGQVPVYDANYFKTANLDNAPLEVFVPARNPKEWKCFVASPPPGVTISECVPPIGCPAGTPTVPYAVALNECSGSWCGGAKFRNKAVQTWYRTTANWLCIRRGHATGACDWDINPSLQGGRYCAYSNDGGSGCDSNNSGINPMIRVHCANPPPPPPSDDVGSPSDCN